MLIKINGVDIASKPNKFVVTVLDLDDADSTARTADGTLTRDRIAVKRQVQMSFPALKWPVLSELMKSMADEFFELYYPDSMSGKYETRTMYVGNRESPVAMERNGEMIWSGLELTLTEQ
ncbi:MAG: hypothetical protein J7559_08525 [Cohnella sp.]|nr:hypothetical protein [Cohnella sp.]